ncbi:hypothetical protein [Sphingopyxis panaciterrae]
MHQNDLNSIIATAIDALYAEEGDIIAFDIGERTLSSCLAWLLKPHFPDHRVHVEFNRGGYDPKDIELPDAEGEPTTCRVFPDIVVHRPGTNEHNLLVIEMKKSTNRMSDADDVYKLDRLKEKYHYAHALFVRLPAGPEASAENVYAIWR